MQKELEEERELTRKELHFEGTAISDHEDLGKAVMALTGINEEAKNKIIDHSASQTQIFILESQRTRETRAWTIIPDVIEAGKRARARAAQEPEEPE